MIIRRSTRLPTIPNIAPPSPGQDVPVREQLTQEVIEHDPRHHATLPLKPPAKVVRFNKLYDSLRTESGWRYLADAYANGTFTPVANGSISVPVVLNAQAIPLRLSQWPNGVQAYWCVHNFSCAPQVTSTQPVEVNVPATAGAVTLFTGPGVLTTVTVTATGTTDLEFQDGAGNIIAEVPSTATLDQVFTFNAPFGTSLVANKATTTPVVTANFQPDAIIPGALEIAFQDKLSMAAIGDFLSNSGGSSGVDQIMMSPITDPSNTQIGNLIVSLFPGSATVGVFNWSMTLGIAYLLPSDVGYQYELGKPEHDGKHHT